VSPSSRTWIAIASADRAYFDAVAPANALFPVHYQSRNYALAEGEVLIGRHSSSRGIAPQIDLSGPQEDMGISHRHVWLERQAEGGYALVDAGSTNGTTINDSPVKVAPHARVPLADGDRIHIGHWTTITLRELGRQRVDTGIWAEEERPLTVDRVAWAIGNCIFGERCVLRDMAGQHQHRGFQPDQESIG
jgi:hypothetical protein